MEELIVRCQCGRTATVPASAMGMVFDCAKCAKPVTVTEANARELTQAERDVRLFVDEHEAPPALRPPTSAALSAPAAATPGGEESIAFQRMGDLGRLAQGRSLPPGLPSANAEVSAETKPAKGLFDDDSEDELMFRRMRDFEPSAPRRMAPPTLPPKDAAAPSGAARVEASRLSEKGAQGGANAARCAQCQRPFRGSWDMIDTAAGTLCHICANKVDNFTLGAAPERPPSGEQSAFVQQIARQYSWTEKPQEPEETDSEKRRQFWLTLAGVAVIAVTLLLLVTGAGHVSPETAATPQQVPKMPNYAFITVRFILHVLTTGLALYFTLSMFQKLPYQSVLADVAAVAVVSVLVHVVNVIPFVGYLAGLLIIYKFYELNLIEFIALFVFGSVAEVATSVIAALLLKFLGAFA